MSLTTWPGLSLGSSNPGGPGRATGGLPCRYRLPKRAPCRLYLRLDRHPDFDSAGSRLGIEFLGVTLEKFRNTRSVAIDFRPSLLGPAVVDAIVRRAQCRDVPAMRENRIPVRRNGHQAEFAGQGGSVRYLDPAEIVHALHTLRRWETHAVADFAYL